MVRFVAALFATAVLASAAVADIPPPPPPKGKKYVSVTSEVLLGKDVTGYVFVQAEGGFGAQELAYKKLELKTDKATAMSAVGRRGYVALIAVPQDAAKAFKTDDDLFAALKTKKLKGVSNISFNGTATVSDKVKENTVKWTYTITFIDAKVIKTKIEGPGYEAPANKPDKSGQDSPEDDADTPTPMAQAPRGGMWVAGTAAFAGIMLGGLWLAGRTRRKL